MELSIEEQMEFLQKEIDTLWLYFEKAVEDRNVSWAKNIMKSIENKTSEIERIQSK